MFAGIVVGVALIFIFVMMFCTETVDYIGAVQDNTVASYVEFCDKYPQSGRLEKVNKHKTLLEEDYFYAKRKKNTKRAYDEFLHAFPHDKYTSEAQRLKDSLIQVDLDIEIYGKNALLQGATPYKLYYGENQKMKKSIGSDIEVTAPFAFDMVVMVKEKNEDGRVLSHAYVKADSTYTLQVENGNLQVFFYIGKGWNPNKKMGNGVVGGFMINETFQKDDPISLWNEKISYKVTMRRNRRYKESSSHELFRNLNRSFETEKERLR